MATCGRTKVVSTELEQDEQYSTIHAVQTREKASASETEVMVLSCAWLHP
jgi:hypothetical protein